MHRVNCSCVSSFLNEVKRKSTEQFYLYTRPTFLILDNRSGATCKFWRLILGLIVNGESSCDMQEWQTWSWNRILRMARSANKLTYWNFIDKHFTICQLHRITFNRCKILKYFNMSQCHIDEHSHANALFSKTQNRISKYLHEWKRTRMIKPSVPKKAVLFINHLCNRREVLLFRSKPVCIFVLIINCLEP